MLKSTLVTLTLTLSHGDQATRATMLKSTPLNLSLTLTLTLAGHGDQATGAAMLKSTLLTLTLALNLTLTLTILGCGDQW